MLIRTIPPIESQALEYSTTGTMTWALYPWPGEVPTVTVDHQPIKVIDSPQVDYQATGHPGICLRCG